MQKIVYYIEVDQSGRVECSGSVQGDLLSAIPTQPGLVRHLIEEPAQAGEFSYFDAATKKVIQIPKGGPRQSFDFEKKSWAFDAKKAYAELERAVKKHLDKEARDAGDWSSMLSARTAAVSGGKFAAQAKPLALWYDDVWEYFFAEVELYKGGQKAWPSVDDFIASLPTLPR